MRKSKLLILLLFMCMALAGMPAMEGRAEDTQGGESYPQLQDENPYRTETVTAMDENGTITEVEPTDGSMEEEAGEESGISLFSTFARALTGSPKVVNFNTGRSGVIYYTEDGTGISGYTSGSYGADAAYLGSRGGRVKFMMSGVVGWVDESQVEVIDVDRAAVISGYEVEGGRLLHGIVCNMKTPGYNTRLDNGPAPSYLSAGTKYYSYDGHYFYTDYSVMIADYQNNTRVNSVNPDNPYYNYYQYLPLRSTTSYSADTLNALLAGKTTASSLMRGRGGAFVNAQNTYGVNALLMTGVAANESAWGTSWIAMNKNNLFGLNAVDESPGTSANTFASPEVCINDFANAWMSRGYLNPNDSRYYGGFLGNKASGINVMYASDPYWGEKAANVAYALDKNQGSQDYGRYTIGIKDTLASSHTTVNVRAGSSTTTSILYSTGNASNYAVLVKNAGPENGFYLIQSDGVLNDARTGIVRGQGAYSFDSMYAYISADYVRVVNQGTASEPAPAPEPEPEPEPAALTGISITAQPAKTAYTEGEVFDPAGMSVQASWSDGTVTDVTGQVGYRTEPLTVDVTAVEISYTSGDVTKTASQPVQVKEKVTVTAVLITPTEITMYPGEAATFGVSVQGTGEPSQSVSWSVDGAAGSQTAIDENGRLTVGEDETAAQLTVTATSVADGTKTAQAVVTVAQREPEVPEEPETPSDEPLPEEPAGDGTDSGTDDTGAETVYEDAELTSESSQITANGTFTAGTSFKTEAVSEETDTYETLTKAAEGKPVLGVYELSLENGEIKAGTTVQVTFPVDPQYNGQEVLVFHYLEKEDGLCPVRYECVVENGAVTVEVESFSPFTIVLNTEPADGNDPDAETPDNGPAETPEQPDNSIPEQPDNSIPEQPDNSIPVQPGNSGQAAVETPGTQNPPASDDNSGDGAGEPAGDAGNAGTGTGSGTEDDQKGNPGGQGNPAGQSSADGQKGANGQDTVNGQAKAAPRTGDTASPVTWILLAVAAAAVIVIAVILKKTRK